MLYMLPDGMVKQSREVIQLINKVPNMVRVFHRKTYKPFGHILMNP